MRNGDATSPPQAPTLYIYIDIDRYRLLGSKDFRYFDHNNKFTVGSLSVLS